MKKCINTLPETDGIISSKAVEIGKNSIKLNDIVSIISYQNYSKYNLSLNNNRDIEVVKQVDYENFIKKYINHNSLLEFKTLENKNAFLSFKFLSFKIVNSNIIFNVQKSYLFIDGKEEEISTKIVGNYVTLNLENSN